MSVKMYMDFIDSLRNQKIKVEKLSLNEIKESFKLYKVIGGIN